MAMQPSPAEDFNVQKNQEGGQTVTGYVGKAEMVYVPDEIDGLPVTEISEYTFANDQTPKAIRLGDNVKSVMFGSFETNKTLEIFVAGKGLEVIADSAFLQAEALKDVRLNEGLKEIDDFAFAGTENLKEITIPNSVEKIGTAIFHFGNESLVIKGTAQSKAKDIAEYDEVTYEEIN
ncbi:leucine-rich repeat domain-containing protein [Allofustis seminis]|uniref:leucine-rich repeat domain-containing protein n=1 Tax=Allofustis seminis TaxID=166939 RepID=UPI000364CC53|nr:leucine-rich repeat domain-containing protein [Allofustis seminis]